MDFEVKRQELVNLLEELKENGCSGIKLSTEDQGASHEFIEFINNIILRNCFPIHVKIGGPDARNDIRKCVEIGVKGLIAPMVESPFGVYKFVTAVESVLGATNPDKLNLSINLESLSSYEKIDAILTIPEIGKIDEIVVGVSDLAKSVGKSANDPQVLEIVEKMSAKSKSAGKVVRVGGLMSAIVSNQRLGDKLLKEIGIDEINTACVAFDVKKMRDLKSAYRKAIQFEIQLNELWITYCEKRLVSFQRSNVSLKKNLEKSTNSL